MATRRLLLLDVLRVGAAAKAQRRMNFIGPSAKKWLTRQRPSWRRARAHGTRLGALTGRSCPDMRSMASTSRHADARSRPGGGHRPRRCGVVAQRAAWRSDSAGAGPPRLRAATKPGVERADGRASGATPLLAHVLARLRRAGNRRTSRGRARWSATARACRAYSATVVSAWASVAAGAGAVHRARTPALHRDHGRSASSRPSRT
jgi:hypothetical protein